MKVRLLATFLVVLVCAGEVPDARAEVGGGGGPSVRLSQVPLHFLPAPRRRRSLVRHRPPLDPVVEIDGVRFVREDLREFLRSRLGKRMPVTRSTMEIE